MTARTQRRHQLPKRLWRYSNQANPFGPITRRQQYLIAQSSERYRASFPQGDTFTVLRGEVGQWQGIQIIQNAG